jgi:uroporphyrinogen decarboxylase
MIPNDTIIKRMIDSHQTDRIGFNEIIWLYTLKKWVKDEGYPIDEQGNPISPIEHFGFDMYEISGWFDVNPLCGHEEIIEETPEWTIKRNGAGGMLKYWKDRAGTPEHIGFDMTNREVWENKYRDHLLTVDYNRFVEPMSTVADRLRKKSADGFWTFYGHMCFWETMRQSLGDMCMYESLLLDPEWIHDYNRVYTDFFKLHYAKLIEEGGKPDGIWMFEDLGYKNGLVCSPDTLKKLVFPYFQEMVQFFKSYDLPVFLHSCGGIETAIPLITEAGFVGLHGLEVCRL